MAKFKVGSFNLYNLVLPKTKYYRTKKYSKHDYKLKTKWISSQLNAMDADIVGFQEVFHKKALLKAIEKTKFSTENVYVLGETGKSPVVGLASTFPLVGDPVSIKDIPKKVTSGLGAAAKEISKFSRPILKAKIALYNEITATVFVCHLKSKRPTFLGGEDKEDLSTLAIGEARSLLRRSVEATGLRQLIINESAQTTNPIILIGDLNDSTRSVTTNIISGTPPWKFAPIAKKRKHWDSLLYSTFDVISLKSHKNEWPTHIYNGHYESLDHIFVSQEFSFKNRERIGNIDFVHVLDDHLKDTSLSRDRLHKWQSDHAQVVASLSLE